MMETVTDNDELLDVLIMDMLDASTEGGDANKLYYNTNLGGGDRSKSPCENELEDVLDAAMTTSIDQAMATTTSEMTGVESSENFMPVDTHVDDDTTDKEGDITINNFSEQQRLEVVSPSPPPTPTHTSVIHSTNASTSFSTTVQQQQQDQPAFQQTTTNINKMTSTTTTTSSALVSGRPPICLYLSCNPDHLSEYQCAIRKQIEFFEALQEDIDHTARGRNKPIVMGQVGIRCRHCGPSSLSLFGGLPVDQRARGSMYFPTTLLGIYQASQILAKEHFLREPTATNSSTSGGDGPPNSTTATASTTTTTGGGCSLIPSDIRSELQRLKKMNSHASVGKEYWGHTARALGVYESEDGCLRFSKDWGYDVISSHDNPRYC